MQYHHLSFACLAWIPRHAAAGCLPMPVVRLFSRLRYEDPTQWNFNLCLIEPGFTLPASIGDADRDDITQLNLSACKLVGMRRW